MYIHEVIIDGFKSYAQRTVVSGFDPQFNAITGLNGTGKSNILDAICFVLGISNLSQVRVGNLQELVYKQGQAGVTKASVTIVFNNSDPSGSPVGYESHKQITVTRQVVIGGKNKYIINGHTVQQNQVQNLFHSVQLNVNNPHFLIMQGRITKVLNMKPMETLSMIEEAAGTRMFETKKLAAIKTIEKKQLKVDELTKCMNDEITPTLENLRTERVQYQQWLSNSTEVERLERFCIAHEYRICEEKVNSSESDQRAIVAELDSLQQLQTDKTEEAATCTANIEAIENMRAVQADGPLQELKRLENDLSKELVKCNTLLGNQKDSLSSEEASIVSIRKQIDVCSAALVTKEAELSQCMTELAVKEREVAEADLMASSMMERYQNAVAGVADDSSADLLSIPEQVAQWEKRARETGSQLQQGTMRAQHIAETIKTLKKSLKQQEATHGKSQAAKDEIKAKLVGLESQLSTLTAAVDSEAALRSQLNSLRSSTTDLRDHVEKLSAQLEARLSFEFRDPERGFDRSKVKGLVAKLVRIPDKKHATALEIVAGAKLFQVVVDTEQTGKMLLQKGGLKKRVTILPLNKLDNRCMDPAKVNAAKAIARSHRGAANLALELVGYDAEVSKAMEYVFGNTIICENAALAEAIAFDRNIRTKTVTLDGDVYDPSGTLTGGSKSELGMLLAKLEELASMHEQLNEREQQCSSLQRELAQVAQSVARSRDVSTQIEMCKQELDMCEERIASSNYASIAGEIEGHEAQLSTLQAEADSLREIHNKANAELTRLRDSQASMKKSREKAMKDMENQVKAAQKKASLVRNEVGVVKSKRDSVQGELNGLTAELAGLQEQLQSVTQGVTKLTADIAKLTAKVADARAEYEAAHQALQDKQAELNKCSKEIKALEVQRDKCLKAAQNANLEARKITHKLKQWEKDFKDAGKAISAMLRQHPWIEREKEYFGVPGSAFDFSAGDVSVSQKRLKEIKSDQDKLAKKINKKVMGMIEKAEAEYSDLARKREVILKDKEKIESVIEELDIKKAQALQSTWVKVNRDFGSIFSMLLPGTAAKLEPQEGCDVSEGLEVKVAFNGVWKDSLTELSGGQRSLLALSLILSLLLFKPAPMYILDEVDAALDLSHTQNIGLMLRTHFSSSQFIVVSLKEGMFNNANVIFRTRFVDGVSAVQRTVVNNGKSAPRITAAVVEDDGIEEENPVPRKKGKDVRGAQPKGSIASAVEI